MTMPSNIYMNMSLPPNTYIAYERRGTALGHAIIYIPYEIGYIVPVSFDKQCLPIIRCISYYHHLIALIKENILQQHLFLLKNMTESRKY